MRPLAEQYRDRLIRIVVSDRPAAVYPVHQPLALDDFCNLLADCAEAKELLRHKGYSTTSMSILDIVRSLPVREASPAAKRKRKRRR